MAGQEREQPFDLDSLNAYADYWEAVRECYYPFESGLKSGTAEVYDHEIPGGQYSNLRPQAIALGLEHRFEQIKKNYAVVNRTFGDIVKVTPSSKVVGDMALFMTANGLSEEDVMAQGERLAFPDSVVDLFSGMLGQTEGGFPPELSRLVLKGRTPLTEPPGASVPAVDFEAEFAAFQKEFDDKVLILDFLSFRMYPQVFRDFYRHQQEFGGIDYLPAPAFFYGMQQGEEILVKLQQGRTISIRYVYRSKPDDNGNCKVTFELNGQTRSSRANLRVVDGETLPVLPARAIPRGRRRSVRYLQSKPTAAARCKPRSAGGGLCRCGVPLGLVTHYRTAL